MIAIKFNQNLADWFCVSWRYLEEQTLGLMRYIEDQRIDEILSTGIMNLSRMVDIQDVVAYYNYVKTFSKYSSFTFVLDALSLSAPWNSDQKLGYAEFVDLVEILMTNGTD